MEATLFFDGGSRGNPGPSGYGCALLDGDGKLFWTHGDYIGTATNNDAEWAGLLGGLRGAVHFGVLRLRVRGDSALILNQVRGKWKCKIPRLAAYRDEAWALMRKLGEGRQVVEFKHVPRTHNSIADKLANDAMDAMGPVGDPIPAVQATATVSVDDIRALWEALETARMILERIA